MTAKRRPPAMSAPVCLPLGADGVLVKFSLHPDPAAMRAAQAFGAAMRRAPPDGVVETAVSLVSVFLRFDPLETNRLAVTDAVSATLTAHDWACAAGPRAARRWRIPAVFGNDHGPALADAAALAGLSEAEAIENLTAADLSVLAIGFAPGQPYLGLLDDRWDLPRLANLTPQVPAGAIVVAVRQLVLFANPSTTGWRHIGQTAFRPFDKDAAPPFALDAGDALRLHAVSPADFAELAKQPMGGATCEALE